MKKKYKCNRCKQNSWKCPGWIRSRYYIRDADYPNIDPHNGVVGTEDERRWFKVMPLERGFPVYFTSLDAYLRFRSSHNFIAEGRLSRAWHEELWQVSTSNVK